MVKQKILFADDEVSIRGVISSIITHVCPNYEVVLAEDGLIAYAKFKELRELKEEGGLALILTDLKMPNLDGLGFIRKIKENYPEDKTPILALTGYATHTIDPREKSYFREILFKPITLPKLKEIVEKHALRYEPLLT